MRGAAPRSIRSPKIREPPLSLQATYSPQGFFLPVTSPNAPLCPVRMCVAHLWSQRLSRDITAFHRAAEWAVQEPSEHTGQWTAVLGLLPGGSALPGEELSHPWRQVCNVGCAPLQPVALCKDSEVAPGGHTASSVLLLIVTSGL